jgi:hypothetical protein
MNTLIRHLRFEPHGKRLLTASASFWLLSARVLVFVMALSEMVAWGYLGSLFGEGWISWVACGFMAFTIFVVIWIVDASLITLDRAAAEHSRSILGHQNRQNQFPDLLTFALRILLLIGSLTVTAPYLAQAVFHNDIEQFLATQAASSIDKARAEMSEKFDSEIEVKNQEMTDKQTLYEREVAGKGLSGRYGSGPAAEALRQEVLKQEADLKALRDRKESALGDLDRLAQNWNANREKLATTYNLQIPKAGILENRKALEALRRRPEFQATEFAIKAFLAFVFAGLLLLKMFEPGSVRLYLSEVLQQEFSRYKAGSFDSMLPAAERSTSAGYEMTPQRLHEFLVNVWVPMNRLEAQQADAKARRSVALQNLELLEQMKSRINSELSQISQEVQTVCGVLDEASRSLTELHSAIAAVSADLAYYQGELESIEKHNVSMDEGNHLQFEMKRLEYRSQVQAKIAEADRALRELKESAPVETERFNRATAALKRVEAKLEQKEDELAKTQSRIRSVRDEVQASTSDRTRSILRSATT